MFFKGAELLVRVERGPSAASPTFPGCLIGFDVHANSRHD